MSITEHIYTGSMSSIKNDRQMCRLGIEYLIDMTNMRPDDLNRQTLGKLPCLCAKQHSRLTISVTILDTSFKSLFAAFSEVNKFIQRAKKSALERNKVLIFGKEFFSHQVICALTQYLMVDYEMSLDQALEVIFQKYFHTKQIQIEKCYLVYLKQLETYLQHLSINFYPPKQLAPSSYQQHKLSSSIKNEKRPGKDSTLIVVKNKKYENNDHDDYDDDDEADTDYDDYNDDDDDDDDEGDESDDEKYSKSKFSNLVQAKTSARRNSKLAWQ